MNNIQIDTKKTMNDNVQANPFFAALLDHIPNLEKSCVSKNWILCIPQPAALPESHRLSLRLLKMHVLVPTMTPNEFNTLTPGIRICRINEKELKVHDGEKQRGLFVCLFFAF